MSKNCTYNIWYNGNIKKNFGLREEDDRITLLFSVRSIEPLDEPKKYMCIFISCIETLFK